MTTEETKAITMEMVRRLEDDKHIKEVYDLVKKLSDEEYRVLGMKLVIERESYENKEII